jgi:hypothetical protein
MEFEARNRFATWFLVGIACQVYSPDEERKGRTWNQKEAKVEHQRNEE